MTVGESLLLVVVAIAVAVIVGAVRSRATVTVTVALFASCVTVLCLWLPARLQTAGLVVSKLSGSGLLDAPSVPEISSLTAHWALELAAITAGEWVLWHVVLRRRLADVPLERADKTSQQLALLLITIGSVATVVFPARALEDRAEEGNGLTTLLRTFLLVGLAVLAYHRAFGRPWMWGVLAIGTALLVAGNVRSPLLVLVLAFVVGELQSGAIRRTSRLVVTVVLVLLFALGGSFMSSMRANITRDYGLGVDDVLRQTVENPWIAPYESGIDTLDGYRFSELVAPLEPARPSDLLGAVSTFVPRALWPGKPESISVELSATYLDYRASGQFLSPVGYLRLTLGSYPLAVIGFAAFGLLIAAALRLTHGRFGSVVVVVMLVRFLIGGSSFDIYYGFTLCVPLVAGSLLLRVHRSVQDGRGRAALPANADGSRVAP